MSNHKHDYKKISEKEVKSIKSSTLYCRDCGKRIFISENYKNKSNPFSYFLEGDRIYV